MGGSGFCFAAGLACFAFAEGLCGAFLPGLFCFFFFFGGGGGGLISCCCFIGAAPGRYIRYIM